MKLRLLINTLLMPLITVKRVIQHGTLFNWRTKIKDTKIELEGKLATKSNYQIIVQLTAAAAFLLDLRNGGAILIITLGDPPVSVCVVGFDKHVLN